MSKDHHDPTTDPPRGVSRRSFIQSAGAGAIAAVALGKAEASPPTEQAILRPEDMTAVSLNVNGRTHRLLVEPRWSLLYVIRERLGLVGSKVGCERGECGACTVLIDGVPRYACMTLALEAEGAEVTTIEGLLRGEELGPVQQAFLEKDAFQCGYCTPGQVVAAEGLLRADSDPDLDHVREGMSGNICRCGAYAHICHAVARAAELRKA
ncbi:MAG: (2Fe-2S)-binding protein [Acidobacteriota bacterium]